MADERPRYFFGLLCAHKWENIGTGKKTLGHHSTQTVIQQCEHCGTLRNWP